jgi:PIN domain nuclease of toxin-antitoxin system
MAVDLPEHHSDPQDRIIMATALAHDAKLMSSDSKFPIYAELAGRLL